jgi:hypothetical protein
MPIWYALLAAPVLALLDESVAFATAGWACAHQQPLVLHGVHFAFFAATLGGTLPAWRVWRATSPGQTGDEPRARRHFLAGLAMATAPFCALVIVALWVPTWLLASCID